MNNIVMLGPQASGKGTQAEILSKKLGIPTLSVGGMLREEKSQGTKLGKLIALYIDKGKLAPNEITCKLLRRVLKQARFKEGVILDGFPRNMGQMRALGQIFEVDRVIFINISDKEAVRRIAGRRVCSRCGANYHLLYRPPKKSGFCDECGVKLRIRDDDRPKAIRERLKIYHQKTERVIDFYRKKGVLLTIKGEQSILKVAKDIEKALEYKNLKI